MKFSKDIPQYDLYARKPVKEAMNSFFNIQKLSELLAKEGLDHHPHRHPALYQISWITKGCGTYFIDMSRHELAPNRIYLLSPGVVHACECQEGQEGYVIHFSLDFLEGTNALQFLPEGGYQIVQAKMAMDQKDINLFLSSPNPNLALRY